MEFGQSHCQGLLTKTIEIYFIFLLASFYFPHIFEVCTYFLEYNSEKKMENKGTVHGPKLARGYSPRGPAACATWQPTRPNGPRPSQPKLAPRRPGRPSHSARRQHAPWHGHHARGARGGVATVSGMTVEVLCDWWLKHQCYAAYSPDKVKWSGTYPIGATTTRG
jgi:hypothetical protein